MRGHHIAPILLCLWSFIEQLFKIFIKTNAEKLKVSCKNQYSCLRGGENNLLNNLIQKTSKKLQVSEHY
jgi:hypothetical protein